MKPLPLSLAIFLAALSGHVVASPDVYIYFPSLAKGVLSGDARAFRQVLAQAKATPSGERLEELAELASRFVTLSPMEFLKGQKESPACFGVAFMGSKYVDRPDAKNLERD